MPYGTSRTAKPDMRLTASINLPDFSQQSTQSAIADRNTKIGKKRGSGNFIVQKVAAISINAYLFRKPRRARLVFAMILLILHLFWTFSLSDGRPMLPSGENEGSN